MTIQVFDANGQLKTVGEIGPQGLQGDNTLLIYDDSVFKVTGTAISFDTGMSVVSSGTVAFIQSSSSFVPAPGGRLTLTSGTPVTTSDVVSGTSVWYQPYLHDQLPLWDGSDFVSTTFTATPISLAGLSGSSTVDVFAYLNGAVPAYETSMWTSRTVRATELVYQNGRRVKSGDPTRLYLGSLYINANGGQTDDSVTKRFVWNYYNRLGRRLYLIGAGGSHAYTSAAWRYWNNDSTTIVQRVCGVAEDSLFLDLLNQFGTISNGVDGQMGIGLDVATPSYCISSRGNSNRAAAEHSGDTSIDQIGYHFYSLLEYGNTNFTMYNETLSMIAYG